MSGPTVAIIGGGSLGRSIVLGLLRQGSGFDGTLRVTTRSRGAVSRWPSDGRLAVRSVEEDSEANCWAVRGAQMVLLAVRVEQVPTVSQELARNLDPGAVLVSLAAAPGLGALAALLPSGTPLARAMPSTASEFGLGVTGLSWSATAADVQRHAVAELFSQVGRVLELSEEQLTTLTGALGATAFHYTMAAALARALEERGFSGGDARAVAGMLLAGAAKTSEGSRPFTELIAEVATPGGTTEQGLRVLRDVGLDDAVARAVQAAADAAHTSDSRA